MATRIVVGAQWGDEGKGKMVDYLARDSQLIVRFQGGDNAGHTVVNERGVFKLHLIPCGIFYDDCSVLAGTGMVINPDELLREISEIESKGVNSSRLYISERAIILMPYHITLDELFERSKNGIGTTKRGIGPAYADKARRIALRMGDLKDLAFCKTRLESVLPLVNLELKAFGGKEIGTEELFAKLKDWSRQLSGRIVEPVSFVRKYVDQGKNVLFEGQLGIMKDLDLGIYPYVTSSNPTVAYACASSGISIRKITNIIGVIKSFSSAVGQGPFPTEMGEEESVCFRGSGERVDDEFGARTGRARRLGWLDLPVVKYGADINGYTELAVCKIDKLDGFQKIKVCVGYELDGKIVENMPNTEELYRVKPVYREMDGWMCDTTATRRISDLPENAKKYLKLIEEFTGVKVVYAGVGPDRDSIATL